VAKLAGLDDSTKRSVKTELEKRLPAIRQRIQGLPDVSRRGSYLTLHEQLIWLEIHVKTLRDDLYNIQMQEELEV
jgi:hypothetical protein